jgi:hypothetical protein
MVNSKWHKHTNLCKMHKHINLNRTKIFHTIDSSQTTPYNKSQKIKITKLDPYYPTWRTEILPNVDPYYPFFHLFNIKLFFIFNNFKKFLYQYSSSSSTNFFLSHKKTSLFINNSIILLSPRVPDYFPLKVNINLIK